MLHITNGDSAVNQIAGAGIAGDVLAWRDVLHEGPVPEGLALEALSRVRARFIADRGWGAFDEVASSFEARDHALARFGDHEEVVLWFEHDLFDQLQVLQILDWLGAARRGATRVTLVCEPEYVSSLAPERARELFAARRDVTPVQYALAREAWAAFRSPDPTRIEALVGRDTSVLPFLAAALRRHLEQFPSIANGLSRSEAQALRAIADGAHTLRAAFVAVVEDPIFLGDTVFVWYLEELASGRAPLVRIGGETAKPIDREVALTPAGAEVLAGRADRVALDGIDRWFGGAHLSGREAAWRWDTAAGRLRASV